MASGTAGSVWISHQDALFRVRGASVVERIPLARLGKGAATALIGDPLQNGLWLGFKEGGVAFFKDGQIRALYTAANELGAGPVNDFKLDHDGTLWVSTDGGLSRLKNHDVATLTSKNALPCDAVKWAMEDDAHSFWLYMACGLVRIARPELDAWAANPKRTIQATVFNASDGVESHSFTSGYHSAAKSADGTLWFLSFGGLFVLDPRHLPYNKIPPPAHIEQIMADGKEYDAARGPLPPLVRDLTIDYTALSLVVPEKVRFRVKLEGQDKDWKEVSDRRAHYTNLAPKHYRFLVKACNNSGVWNEEGAALDFIIPPAWYQTNWFRALCIAAALLLLWTIYRIRLSVLERRQLLLERHQGEITALNDRLMKAQEEERTRIAGELHDGVLQQLTFVALSLGAVKYELPGDSEVKKEIDELQSKLKDIGTDIRQLSHELHPAILEERGLPDALSGYCEEFSKVRSIPVSYEADANVRELSPGAALCIYRIAQEALGNIARHSKAKNVQVRLTRSDGRVRLTVSDDGIGFTPAQAEESTGLGLINMRERVRQLKGTLEFDSEPGRGTTLRAEVPFRPAS